MNTKRAILCIDDEIIVLDSLKEQLENSFGDEVFIETIESGAEAIEVLEDLKEEGIEVAVVIADYIMPEMTGDKVLEQIHMRSPSTRKILLTGQASLKGVEYAVNKAGLYRFLSKPWEKNDLVLTIKEAIRSFEQEKTIHIQNEELRELNAGLEEKVAQRTKELQELNATKDKFFSIIAHDLKNPFNALLGFSDLLLENYTHFPDEKRLQFIGLMSETAKGAYDLLQNLLEWSRAQTGSIKCNPDRLNLQLLVEEQFSIFRTNAAEKKITLSSELDANQVFADENMIRTVLRNLISNALKFTREGGEVKVNTKKVEDNVAISVEDNGIGIRKDDIAKLFRIDVSHSTPGTANESGTGLGLILCREFIETNKGTIDVESIPNKGSVFTFTLPVK